MMIPGATGTASSFPDGFTGSPLANVETISATKVLTTADRRTQLLTPSGALQIAQLPATALIGEGWQFSCGSSAAFSLQINASNGTTIATLAPGESTWMNALIALPVSAANWGLQIPSTVLANGTVSTPALRFTGSGSDTGIYSPSTDAIAFSNAGVQSLLVSAAGEATFAGPVSTNASHLGGYGLVPVGTIVAYNPGFYTDGTNGGFTVTGPTANGVTEVNAFLTAKGWYVCDGTAPAVPGTPIWNVAGRRLPFLTGDRFLRGGTSAGTQAGDNTTRSIAHTHSVTSNVTVGNHTLSEANLPAHQHTINHDHGAVSTDSQGHHFHFAANSDSVTSSAGLHLAWSRNANNDFSYGLDNGRSNTTPTELRTSSTGAHTHSVDLPNFTGSSGNGAGTATAITHSVTNNGVTSGAMSASSTVDILPQYLTTYFIIRVF